AAGRALRIREAHLGPGHLAVAEALLGLGSAFNNGGGFERLVGVERRALAIREAAPRPGHLGVAEALHLLGTAMTDVQTSYDEAEALLQRALRIRRAALGPSDRRVLSSQAALANIYSETGDRRRGIGMYEQVVEVVRARGQLSN